MRKTEYRIVLPQLDDLQELKVMLAERLEEWALGYKAEGVQLGMQQGKAEGKVEGVQLGEALALQKLLSKRFGAMPSEILEKIASASQEQIEAWFDQAIDAKSVVDVFGPTPY
jgi:flagellar biosynthesis/type III secretory pathway protein FliH